LPWNRLQVAQRQPQVYPLLVSRSKHLGELPPALLPLQTTEPELSKLSRVRLAF
jgi:hypothetical protein